MIVTYNHLQRRITSLNEALARDLSLNFIGTDIFGGSLALIEFEINKEGKINHKALTCDGSYREMLTAAQDFLLNSSGSEKISHFQAITLCAIAGIDFKKNHDQLSQDDFNFLHTLAEGFGYKQLRGKRELISAAFFK